MKYYFDLSTTARWSGHAVGIVRVERELGRRWFHHRDNKNGGFCIYVQSENSIRILPDEMARDVIDGRVRIDFDGAKKLHELAERNASLRWRLREIVLSQPRLYQQVQRLRGRSFSLEQIEEIRRSEALLSQRPEQAGPRTISVGEAAPENLELDHQTLIISGGLDWEYKNIRGLYKMKQAHGFRYASIIYDLIPILYPHFVVPSYVNLLRDYFGELFWLADYCLSISAKTQSDMLEYCKDWGVPAPATAYFPLGGDLPLVDTETAVLPEALVGKRYAIFVSTIEPRKNHRTVYQAWEGALRSGNVDKESCRLVFIGMGGWNTGDLRGEMAANPWTRDTIVTLSGVSDTELALLYQNAEFSLFPSFYEGYGLPVAESLSYGVPCICSNAGSLPEIAGDLIQYCDPGDPMAWSKAIGEAFSKPEAVHRQAEVIRTKFKVPTWDEAANCFFARLQGLIQERAE